MKRDILMCICGLLIAPSAWALNAMMLENAEKPYVAPTTSNERSGTINMVRNATVQVDNTLYLFNAGSLKINVEGFPNARGVKLEKGKKIRFKTQKSQSGGMEEIVEVWMK